MKQTKNSHESSLLVVDDMIKNIQIVGTVLKSKNYNVVFAESGEEALEKVLETNFDLILLDVMMPHMNGFEVCTRLKQDARTAHIPVIFLTALSETNYIAKGFEVGGVDYIVKPFHIQELLIRVQTHLKIQQQQKKLHELILMRDKFFSIIAHDLKNPFSSLIAFSDMLVTDYNLFDESKRQEILQKLNNSAHHGYKLLENLLEWARSQTGTIRFVPQNHILRLLCSHSLSSIKENATQKNITLTIDINPEIIVWVDADMTETIIRNLVSNAIKFTNKNGKIKLSATKIDDKVQVAVTDTGIGMSIEQINNLFRIDVSQSRTGTNGESGTGLGLILCKEFVEKQDGTIQVTSKEGKGSTFTFTLPTN